MDDDRRTPAHPEAWVFGLALVAVVASVGMWAVDLPYLDEWVLAGDLSSEGIGELVERAWTPHNEHRLIVPRLLLVALARWTSWNVRWEVFVGVALAVGIAALCWRLGARIEGRAERATFRSLAVLLALGLHQVENFVWGWQVSVFLCVLAALGALATLSSGEEAGWRRLAAAVGLGLVSSFSYAAGLVVWPAGAVVLALRSAASPRHRWLTFGVWLALGVATWIAYRPGDADVGGIEPLEQGLHALAFLASPLVRAWPTPWLGVAVGLGGLSVAAFVGWDSRAAARPRALWVGTIVFALGTATLTALGRADFGLSQALSSRYSTLANLFWIGLLGLALEDRRVRWPMLALTVGVGAGVVSGSAASLDDFVGQFRIRSTARAFLERGVLVEELAPRIAGELENLEVGAWIACEERLGPYRGDRNQSLECRFEIWPEAVDGQRALPDQRFTWVPGLGVPGSGEPGSGTAGLLRTDEGFALSMTGDEVEGHWTLSRDEPERRCLRGWAVDTVAGRPVAEVIVAEGRIGRRLAFRRQSRRGAEDRWGTRFVGISGCWRPAAEAVGEPVTVFVTTDRGTAGRLSGG